MRPLPILAALALLAGCASSDAPLDPAAADLPASTPLDLWAGATRLELGNLHKEIPGTEADVLCTFGGGYEVPRTDARVLPGTASIEVTSAGSRQGAQIGYSLDGAEVTWLEPAYGDKATRSIPVGADQVETPGNATRWTFHAQYNPPEPLTQDCFTGVGFGELHLVIEAVRDGAEEGAAFTSPRGFAG